MGCIFLKIVLNSVYKFEPHSIRPTEVTRMQQDLKTSEVALNPCWLALLCSEEGEVSGLCAASALRAPVQASRADPPRQGLPSLPHPGLQETTTGGSGLENKWHNICKQQSAEHKEPRFLLPSHKKVVLWEERLQNSSPGDSSAAPRRGETSVTPLS